MVVVLFAALVGWAGGDRALRIRGHRLRAPGLLLASVSVLFCEPTVASTFGHVYPAAMILATMLMIQFAMRNLHVPGIPLVALGMLLNAAVVVANGSMPLDASAAERAGVSITRVSDGADHRHRLADSDTNLSALGDRVAVPLPGHRETDSLGDIAIAAGAGLCAFTAVRRRRGIFGRIEPSLA